MKDSWEVRHDNSLDVNSTFPRDNTGFDFERCPVETILPSLRKVEICDFP